MLMLRRALFAVTAGAALFAPADDARAAGALLSPKPAISQQYYNDNGAIGSRMYPSPRPVPGWVGNTWYTYQPFHSHKFMWSHFDVYRKRHASGGVTTTRAYYW